MEFLDDRGNVWDKARAGRVLASSSPAAKRFSALWFDTDGVPPSLERAFTRPLQFKGDEAARDTDTFSGFTPGEGWFKYRPALHRPGTVPRIDLVLHGKSDGGGLVASIMREQAKLSSPNVMNYLGTQDVSDLCCRCREGPVIAPGSLAKCATPWVNMPNFTGNGHSRC